MDDLTVLTLSILSFTGHDLVKSLYTGHLLSIGGRLVLRLTRVLLTFLLLLHLPLSVDDTCSEDLLAVLNAGVNAFLCDVHIRKHKHTHD